MIKASHHPIYQWFFLLYTKWKLKRHFKRVVLRGEGEPDENSMLIVANHFSWWDGFIVLFLNSLHFRKRFHVMMLEDQLRKNMFLNKLGAFSVKKSDRSLVESMNYAAELLQKPGNMVLFFPQGEFQSHHLPEIRFEKGIQRLVKQADAGTRFCMICNLIDYFEHDKPTLTVYYKIIDNPVSDDVESLYNTFYKSCIAQQKQ
jgi:1-acyl-sn-glycerol-3-phosphate acyltransferase